MLVSTVNGESRFDTMCQSQQECLRCLIDKMCIRDSAQTMNLQDVDELITDEGIEQEDLEAFRNLTSVTTVPVEE